MSGHEPHDEKRVRLLMMGALDGELEPDRMAEFDALLERSPEVREEWARMRQVKAMTSEMSYRAPPEEVWDGYWQGTYRRFERGLGWILFSVGAISVVGYGLWTGLRALWSESGLPEWLRIAIFAVALGGTILTVSVLREKWFTYGRDPYRGVRR